MFDEPKSAAPSSPKAQVAGVEEWIESLEQSRTLAIQQMLNGDHSNVPAGPPADPSTVPGPSNALDGPDEYSDEFAVSNQTPKISQPEDTKRNLFGKRQSKNGIGPAF